jgi:hypothetical protein
LAIFEGTELRKKQVGKYVCRRQEPKKRGSSGFLVKTV